MASISPKNTHKYDGDSLEIAYMAMMDLMENRIEITLSKWVMSW